MRKSSRLTIVAAVLFIGGWNVFASSKISSLSGIQVILDGGKRSFQVIDTGSGWILNGLIDGIVSRERTLKGKDGIGDFEEINFVYSHDNLYRCAIRTYDHRPVILFNQQALDSLSHSPVAFPSFSKFAKNIFLMTFSEREFGAPTVFRRLDAVPDSAQRVHSGPLLLYDSLFTACIISPATNFMIASTIDDAKSLRCGLNSGLNGVPRGFTQSTIVVIEKGINRAWDSWGRALTDLHGKKRPANDADVGLKYLGYWTDNGATYYYHYDTCKGYDGTLLALKKRYVEEHIPIRSIQLDSWWYSKGYDNPDGSMDRTEKRIVDLPAGSWNRFGGLLKYAPSPELFPKGLKQFRDSIRLPLITHNRWISRESPYRDEYKISGIGAVDPRWWDDIMKSISSWGVATYEQDWLDRIYKYSPEFSTTTWAGEEFMNAMANSARVHGLTMQYCMALPRHYLQGGSSYSNLTSIRVSGDRFHKDRWKEFLYASRMASALGVWPWTDVFMSKETPNILLATLSAGMVGIGDAIGDEDTLNIMRSVRTDGVIVKPDVSLVPIDKSYVDDGVGFGLRIATTYTDQGKSLKTIYLFAYADSANRSSAKVLAADVGITGKMFMYNYFSGTGRIVESTDSLALDLGQESYSYAIFAPLAKNGIAFIGDPGKFVTCGKKRIGRLAESKDRLTASILVSKGEHSVKICGYAPKMPQFLVYGGFLGTTNFDPGSHIFKLELIPQENLNYHVESGDAVGKIVVEFKKAS